MFIRVTGTADILQDVLANMWRPGVSTQPKVGSDLRVQPFELPAARYNECLLILGPPAVGEYAI